MRTYQDTILTLLTEKAEQFKADYPDGIATSTMFNFANTGRLIFHDPKTMRTLSTLDFDFQPKKVHMSLNDCTQPCQPKSGPRGESIFWWTPGDPADDKEIDRLVSALVVAVAPGIVKGA